ncbi:MAG: hypothetical protein AAF085_04855 [Planctomycetota bacterium]
MSESKRTTTPEQAQNHIDEVRLKISHAKRAVSRSQKSLIEFKERQARDLMEHIATADRWVIGYGAGIAYLAIEGVGFLSNVPIGYRLFAAILAMISLIYLGLEKILRREALRVGRLELDKAYQGIECVYDELETYEDELANIEGQQLEPATLEQNADWLDSKIDDVYSIDNEFLKMLSDWDKGISPESVLAEEMMPILKKRMDMWSLFGLGIATAILILGVLHLVIFNFPIDDKQSAPQDEAPTTSMRGEL